MTMKTRLFIGNLASTVTEEELRDKFSSLLASHKEEAQVGNVEVRCKNENNYFGFVDVHLNSSNPSDNSTGGGGKHNGIPLFLRKNIDLMNNTKWKGSLIKVQFAKESFIEKLRREQQENQTAKPVASFQPNGRISSDTAANSSEQTRNQKHANDILNQLNRSKERRNRSNKFQNSSPQKGNGNCGFEVVSNDIPASDKSHKSPVKSGSPVTKQKKKQTRKSESSSSSEDDSDDNVRDGIPKFKGLLICYPDGIPEAKLMEVSKKEAAVPEVKVIEEETPIQQKLLSLAFEKDHIKPAEQPSNKSMIKFKKNKQQQSDLLRLQSLEKMKELKAQRKNLISSALSTVAASAPLTEQRKLLESEDDDDSSTDSEAEAPTSKKSKMTLFDDDDEEEEDKDNDDRNDGDVFQVKKQFEGAGGQKLLELKTRWGNDNRFKIDDRFKDSDAEEDVEPMEQEKEKQMDILTGILGKVVSSKTKAAPGTQKKGGATTDTFSSVIMPRYDPEADEENDEKTEETEKIEEEHPSKSSKKTQKEKKSATTEVTEKTRSTEPATFKTVSNLKALFSSGGDDESAKETTSLFNAPPAAPATSSFSLLATFGKTDAENEKDAIKQASEKKSGHAEGPRTFWQSNPFRYDSSDDEGESEKVKVTIKGKPEAPATGLVVHGKTSFFFTEKDARFEGLEDYFLHYEKNTAENGEVGIDGVEKNEPVEDFSVKRQELKSIVKAKIRNSRRKDEKRTLAIKRAIRKRKRKVQHRSKSFG